MSSKRKMGVIRAIGGGRDPQRALQEFLKLFSDTPSDLLSRDDETCKEWIVVDFEQEIEFKVQVQKGEKGEDTVVYLALRVTPVILRYMHDMIIVALELADVLVGVKISLVGGFLVISSSLAGNLLSYESLKEHHRLLLVQRQWLREALCNELGLDSLPETFLA